MNEELEACMDIHHASNALLDNLTSPEELQRMASKSELPLDKSNIVLIGPSGVGKVG